MAVKAKHGAMLAGRYRLLERLGEGGMGSVWKAEHLLLDTHVAIKLLDPDVARYELNLGRFLREAKTLASLRSPHVVQVLDFGSDADTPYLVMELLHGQTLGRRLVDQGRLSLAETSHILGEVCSAIAVVHDQGLIHRDLKPDNIFLSEAGDGRVAKVVDFGIAKSFRRELTASMKTRTGHMLGTPSYMSPEQCRGLKDIDHRADLWALGVIAYECLVGKVPFQGEVLGDLLLRICMDPLPVPSRQPGSLVPGGFDAWFARAVARDREERFQSAAELAAALAGLSGASQGASSGAPSGGRGPAFARAVAAAGPPQQGGGGSAPRHPAPQQSAPRHPAQQQSQPRHPAPLGSAPLHRAPARAVPGGVGAMGSSPDTVTNATLGVTSPARRVHRRALHLALAGLAVSALVGGVWALGPRRGSGVAASAVSVEVLSSRPAYEVAPRVLRSRVPTGRRLPAAPSAKMPPAGAAAQASSGARPVPVQGMPSAAAAFSGPSPSSPEPSAPPTPAPPSSEMPAALRGTAAPASPSSALPR